MPGLLRNKIYLIMVSMILFVQSSVAQEIRVDLISSKYNIQCMTHSNRHGLFFGTDRHLGLINNNRVELLNIGQTLNIRSLLEYGDSLYIGTEQGQLFVLDLYLHKLECLATLHYAIKSLNYQEESNTLLIGTIGDGLHLKNRMVKKITESHSLYIYDIEKITANDYLLATDQGIKRFSSGRLIDFSIRHLPDIVITRLFWDARIRRVYFGSQLGYIGFINKDSAHILFQNKKPDLEGEIQCMYLWDRNICFGDKRGVYRMKEGFSPIQVNDLKANCMISSENDLWIGGNRFLQKMSGNLKEGWVVSRGKHFGQTLIQNDSVMFYTQKGKLYRKRGSEKEQGVVDIKDEISSVYLDKRGGLWVGTMQSGLFEVSTKGIAKQHVITSSQGSGVILSISGTGDKLYVSTLDGIWVKNIDHQGSFYSLEKKLNIPTLFAYQVLEASNGELWIATDGKGILRVNKKGAIKRVLSPDHKIVYSVLEDGAHNIWFNSYRQGVYKYDGKRLKKFGLNTGLLSNEINGLKNLNDSTLALVSASGIDLLSIDKFKVENIAFSRIGETGLNTMDAKDNLVSVSQGDQVLLYNFKNRTLFEKPMAHIERIYLFNKPLPYRASATFSHRENTFRFWVRAISNQNKPSFIRYRLKGFSHDWMITQDNQIFFPGLKPGSYRFILQASFDKSFSNVSQTSYAFHISEPFWWRWWFIGGVGISLFWLLRNIQRYRERNIKRVQELQKEKAVAEYENLKSQVNPHFLFNNFNTLISLIHEDKDRAIEYTEQLSNFYRSIVRDTEKQLETLREEIRLLENYLFLQRVRIGDVLHLEVENTSPYKEEEIYLPTLTLQILCENAIKHNVINDRHPMYLKILLKDKMIEVWNTLHLKKNRAEGLGIGLDNIKNRYKYFSEMDITVERDEVYFKVKLPVILK